MDVFKLVGSIFINSDEANEKIDETTGKAESASGKIGKAFGTISKGIAVGVGACATAVGTVTKKAVDAFADYEQLVGGVETLFGDSAKAVINYADVAFETAGLSANDYMETVTSFSASLLKSLDDDTAKSAEYANRAIIDMADNANKMGTSMESIQNAYQGFAKQNYTMLDNLKLGYGGTKEEMQRLIAEASQMKEAQEELGITVDENSMSFGNIVNAISVVQKKMKITGTTAKEASTTIAGSIASMKSSWTNLLTALGNDELDLEVYINGFVNSVATVGQNLLPRVKVILEGVVELVRQLAPIIIEELPKLLSDLLPSVVSTATELFNSLVAILPSLIDMLLKSVIPMIPSILVQIGQTLIDAFPMLLQTCKDLFGQIWDYISLNLLNTGVSFEDALSKMSDIFGKIWDVCQQVWTSIGQPVWDSINSVIQYVKDNFTLSGQDMKGKFQSLMDVFKFLWETIGQPVFDYIVIWVRFVSDIFAQYMPRIMEFFQEAIAGIKDTWNNHLKPVFEAIGNFLNDFLVPAFDFAFNVIIKPLIETVFNTIKSLWNGTLKPVFDGIIDFILGVFTGDWTKGLQGILNIVTGIFNAIKVAIETPMEIAKNLVNSAIDFIKKKFNFDWSFPKLKLPHFNISGSFSLNPLSVPKFGIEWYKKAMDNPMVLDSPTIFGYSGGKFLGGGEAGSEVVAGSQTLMEMIQGAVSVQNSVLADILYKILDAIVTMDENMGGNLREALDGTALEVNKREFARLVKVVT